MSRFRRAVAAIICLAIGAEFGALYRLVTNELRYTKTEHLLTSTSADNNTVSTMEALGSPIQLQSITVMDLDDGDCGPTSTLFVYQSPTCSIPEQLQDKLGQHRCRRLEIIVSCGRISYVMVSVPEDGEP